MSSLRVDATDLWLIFCEANRLLGCCSGAFCLGWGLVQGFCFDVLLIHDVESVDLYGLLWEFLV